MQVKESTEIVSFQDSSQQEHTKLLIDFFALLLEWELEDEQKSNGQKGQKV